jgi:hypothetical protein
MRKKFKGEPVVAFVQPNGMEGELVVKAGFQPTIDTRCLEELLAKHVAARRGLTYRCCDLRE